MKMPGLQSLQVKNFKSIEDSKIIKMTPLTVFIGYNGTGKSSIIEGLETLQRVITEGLDSAMSRWHGFKYILNQVSPSTKNTISFDLRSRLQDKVDSRYRMEISTENRGDRVFIKHESLTQKGRNLPSLTLERNASGFANMQYTVDDEIRSFKANLGNGTSIVNLNETVFPPEALFKQFIRNWQFVSFISQNMGEPVLPSLTGGQVRLDQYGRNIAEYLLDIKRLSPSVFENIFGTLQHILPYSQRLYVEPLSELERRVYLQLAERDFQVPGWLLSTGTLRIVALLALLRHPNPPPLIAIEEIENGLDPSSIHLIIDEIRYAVESGKTQIIMTTHSPFLLDLLDLSHIVLVERVDGQPTFTRPGDRDDLQKWAERFAPGKLYTMGKLSGDQQQ